MKHELPDLPYAYDALEPHIDAKTMEIHHTKHHQTYVDKLNAALEKHPEVTDKTLEGLLSKLEDIPEDIRTTVQNNGGGHYNHSLFWTLMSPDGGGEPEGELMEAIINAFGSFAQFKEKFSEEAKGQFGSGWAWLVVNTKKEVDVYSMPNQNSPLMINNTPILGLDVWEHAYYLKHQNKRADYIETWWNVVNWEEVARRFKEASA